MTTKAKTRAVTEKAGEAYQSRSKCKVGRPHELMNCCDKVRFGPWIDAKYALNGYLREHLYSNMVVYKCPQHGCFHLGHNKRMSNEEICERTSEVQGRVFVDEEDRRSNNTDIMTGILWDILEHKGE